MDENSFKALVVRKKNTSFTYNIEERKIKDLPNGELLIKVDYSNINFKDLMSCKGNPSITRKFPHTPGIDACGTVVSSTDSEFNPNDNVLIICKPMGLNSSGGFSEYIRIPSSWAIKIDEKVDKEFIMAIGTAGFTSAIAINSILNFNKNKPKEVIVSGATGGVGVVSIMFLKNLGIRVTALTRTNLFINNLKSLGVDEIINSDDFLESTKQNLASAKWDAAIDVVGGNVLSSLIKSVKPKGIISVLGNVNSTSFNSNVLPFILRGVSLQGINAEIQGSKERYDLLKKIITEWKPSDISQIYTLINLKELPSFINSHIDGRLFGRIVIKIS